MLVLSRKKGESIVIGDEIELKVVDVDGEHIKLGIEAPQHIAIHRKEIYLAIQEENKEATKLPFDLGDLKNLNTKSEKVSDD